MGVSHLFPGINTSIKDWALIERIDINRQDSYVISESESASIRFDLLTQDRSYTPGLRRALRIIAEQIEGE